MEGPPATSLSAYPYRQPLCRRVLLVCHPARRLIRVRMSGRKRGCSKLLIGYRLDVFNQGLCRLYIYPSHHHLHGRNGAHVQAVGMIALREHYRGNASIVQPIAQDVSFEIGAVLLDGQPVLIAGELIIAPAAMEKVSQRPSSLRMDFAVSLMSESYP